MIYKLCRDNYFPKRMEANILYVWGYGMKRRMCAIDSSYKLPEEPMYYDSKGIYIAGNLCV